MRREIEISNLIILTGRRERRETGETLPIFIDLTFNLNNIIIKLQN